MKLITKIVGATLGLALAIGVSFGAANHRNAKPVYATETPNSSQTLTITRNSFGSGSGYSVASFTESTSGGTSISGYGQIYLTTTASMQFNKSQGVGAIWNTVAIPGAITAISAKTASGTDRAWNAYVYSSACSYSNSTFSEGLNKTRVGTGAVTITTSQTQIGTSSAGYSYFALIENVNNASYLNNITITYTASGVTPDIVEVTGVSITGDITNNSTISNAEYGDTKSLAATVSYRDGDGYTDGDGTVEWSSNHEDRATVSDDGTVTFVGNGEVTITATSTEDDTKSGSVTFTLENIIVPVPTYTVTYNDNGATSGSVPASATEYEENQTVTVLGNTNNLVKTGYIWSGWNTVSDGSGTNYVKDDTFNITKDTILYARWIKDYASVDSFTISAGYLNLTSTATGDGAILTADDGIQYVTSSGTKYNGVSGSNAFDSSSNAVIFIGKTGSYIYNKDSLQKNIHRVEVFANGNGAAGATVAVKFGSSVCSSSYTTGAVNLNPNNKIYTFTSDINNAKFFRVESTAEANAQFQIKVFFIKPTTSVTVLPESVTLAPTETQQLTTTVLPAGSTDGITYSSNKPGVATVSNTGLITAVADGTATITVTSGSYSDTCEVTVETPVVPFVTLENDSISGYTGQSGTIGFLYGNLTSTLGASAKDAKATACIVNDDDNGYAEVEISYVSDGSTEVYVKDGANVLATVSVTITESTVTITGLPATDSVLVGGALDLLAKINITATGSCSDDLTWESANESIATVDELGDVRGVAPGTVNITVTADDYPSATMTCAVKVIRSTNFIGTTTLAADLTSSATYTDGYSFSSNKVTSKTGYYQDNGTADVDTGYFMLKGASPLFSMEPAEIEFTARLGGGTDKADLDYDVEVCFVDSKGKEIESTKTTVATGLTNAPDNYTVSIPYSASAYGVKLTHLKENGWNARYYSFKLSYRYSTSYATLLGDETGGGIESVAMKFSGKIPVTTWSALGTVSDYGIMMFKRKASNSEYSDTDTPVKDAYRDGKTLSVSRKGSGDISADGDYYIFSANVNVSNSANYGVVVCAAPFVVIDGTYYFFDEMEYSVNTLALYHLSNGGSSLSEDALNALKGA